MQVHYQVYVVPHFAEDMLIHVVDVLRRFQSHELEQFVDGGIGHG